MAAGGEGEKVGSSLTSVGGGAARDIGRAGARSLARRINQIRRQQPGGVAIGRLGG